MVGKRRMATALLTAALVTACGSTVSVNRSSEVPAGSSGLGASGPSNALGSDSSLPGEGPGSPSGSGPSGSAPAGGAARESAAIGATEPMNGSAASSVSPAKTGTTIKVGALTASGAAKYQSSLGFKGASGDQIAMTKSMVNYLNAHGGLAGRKIQLVLYDIDVGSFATDEAATMQAACAFFTQDNHVTAVASIAALLPDSFYACMAKAHVPVVLADEGVSSDFLQRYAGSMYMPSGPSYTRLLNDSVDALWNAGWLTAKSTVGLVGYDTNDVHSIVDKGLVPALQRHGLKLAAGMYTATTTSAASEYNAGVLSF